MGRGRGPDAVSRARLASLGAVALAALALAPAPGAGEAATVPAATGTPRPERSAAALPGGPPEPRALARAGGLTPRIVNGLSGVGSFPSVGLLARGGTGGTVFCSGTLIGCHTFLTAAHCVSGWGAGDSGLVYLQHAGLFPVASVSVAPQYCGVGCRSDLGVVVLGAPVTAVRPSPIQTTSKPTYGTTGLIAGFGTIGGGSGGAGVLRYGAVETAACTSVPDQFHVCWNFAVPIGPAGEDSNTCSGDSGGPLFTAHTGSASVAAVTSGGNLSCLAPDNAFDADVLVDSAWIQSTGGSDLASTSCGDLLQAFDPDTAVYVADSSTASSELWSFPVPAGARQVRAAANAVLGRDLDLYLRRGSAPVVDPPAFDCKSAHADTLPEYCQVGGPLADTWYALVVSHSGSSAYQLTATVLGGRAVLDVDGDGDVDALTDGVLVLRYLFGFAGSALVVGAVSSGCANCTAGEVEAYLVSILAVLDIDASSGDPAPLSDGVLVLRWLFGFTGDALVSGAVDPAHCLRCTAAEIAAYLDSLDG